MQALVCFCHKSPVDQDWHGWYVMNIDVDRIAFCIAVVAAVYIVLDGHSIISFLIARRWQISILSAMMVMAGYVLCILLYVVGPILAMRYLARDLVDIIIYSILGFLGLTSVAFLVYSRSNK